MNSEHDMLTGHVIIQVDPCSSKVAIDIRKGQWFACTLHRSDFHFTLDTLIEGFNERSIWIDYGDNTSCILHFSLGNSKRTSWQLLWHSSSLAQLPSWDYSVVEHIKTCIYKHDYGVPSIEKCSLKNGYSVFHRLSPQISEMQCFDKSGFAIKRWKIHQTNNDFKVIWQPKVIRTNTANFAVFCIARRRCYCQLAVYSTGDSIVVLEYEVHLLRVETSLKCVVWLAVYRKLWYRDLPKRPPWSSGGPNPRESWSITFPKPTVASMGINTQDMHFGPEFSSLSALPLKIQRSMNFRLNCTELFRNENAIIWKSRKWF